MCLSTDGFIYRINIGTTLQARYLSIVPTYWSKYTRYAYTFFLGLKWHEKSYWKQILHTLTLSRIKTSDFSIEIKHIG